ncbi:HAD-IIIA family hydrolase [Carboxylicivirga sp. A043]|uniref:KdsC family phosphatase n=1 Tax=Carboxylicivirga litoralis TaxID=2816963 RepID=UPI0021CB2065|nr:HAD-IIIA family hydrolase [Carboxylicivirga sp. A043]MCU4156969.1 HAD-IIIA family hydrolase [Carboxylicivirga sp. A043]
MSNFKEDLMKVKAFVFDVDGVLSPQLIPILDTGKPMRMANIKDGFAIQLAVKLGYPVAIISGGKTESVYKRYEGLGLKHIYQGISDKWSCFEEWMAETGIKAEEVMYMGDDLPDYPVMKHVGIPVCPADAVEEIKSLCKYISDKKGGEGAVRDVMEQVLRAHGKWALEYLK